MIGVVSDAVDEVVDLKDEDIMPPPAFTGNGQDGHAEYLSGLGKLGEDLVLILDVDKILTEENMATAQEIAQRTEE